ncbi:hypothetical protein [Ruminococcus sp. NK3A76]|uniref:hypothetical protein n=1 Tax=Ruminococcus sp. NK3A76 TaxID=877411 RepID=UPI00048B20AF|nr:hypothetical protein [Ruminococcus sp. NK3A76]
MFTKDKQFTEEKYKYGLESQKINLQIESARENILNFYNNNKNICDKALHYYDEFKNNQNKYICNPEGIKKELFRKKLHYKRILVITSNPIERGIFLRWLSEKNNGPLKTYVVNNNAYNIFHETDEISIVHVHTIETGEEPTKQVIDDTCNIFIPTCICSLGICYGFNISRHTIGSVFLSEKTDLIRINFRDSEKDDIVLELKSILSGNSSYPLIRILKSKLISIKSTSILSETQSPSTAVCEFGDFISANSLISNWKVKNTILALSGLNSHKLLGGEMEGGGILTSNIVQTKEYNKWIIIKSICDWGECKNEIIPNNLLYSKTIKDSLQAYAMSNSCGVFNNIICEMCEV